MLFLQEVPRWLEGCDHGTYFVTDGDSDCAVGLPLAWRDDILQTFKHRFCAVHVQSAGFVSVHLPTGEGQETNILWTETVEVLSDIMNTWEEASPPVKFWFIGGDLNITIDANIGSLTG